MRADKVKGLVPEKKDTNGIGIRYDKAFGYNSAISTIGSKELELCEDDILEIMCQAIPNYADPDWGLLRLLAKTISSRIEEVLKVKGE